MRAPFGVTKIIIFLLISIGGIMCSQEPQDNLSKTQIISKANRMLNDYEKIVIDFENADRLKKINPVESAKKLLIAGEAHQKWIKRWQKEMNPVIKRLTFPERIKLTRRMMQLTKRILQPEKSLPEEKAQKKI